MKSTQQARSTGKEQKHELVRATPAEIARQAGLILIVLAIWCGLLLVYLNLTGKDRVVVSESPEPTEVMAPLEATQVSTAVEQPPTVTATVPHTVPAPTTTPGATSVPAPLPTEAETLPSPTDTATPSAVADVSFAAQVLPILTSRCQRCHGGDRTENGLDLVSYSGVMAGSVNGPVVIPGSSTTSRLVQVIVSGEMPMRAAKLPASEIETIANWVDQGALDN